MAVRSQSEAGTMIPAGTAIGAVRLTVRDIDRARAFYEQMLGMRSSEQPDGSISLAAASGPPLLELRGDATAAPVNHRLTGLFHFAVLVPTRRDLAVSLLRLAHGRWPIGGASDHLVSEALYLHDPDGNGIEIYRDRARSEWPRALDGAIQMATLPLDLDDLLGELTAAPIDPDADRELAAGTKIGHVHLQVSELAEVEQFYSTVLGFDVIVRDFPQALFVSAGGYHHHIGLNTWNSLGAGAPGPGAAGLRYFELKLGDDGALADVLGRIDAAGLPTEKLAGRGTLVRDPSGNGVVLAC